MIELNIPRIRKIIGKRVLRHLRECDANNEVRNIVFQTFPGSGKTTSVMKTVDDANYTWMYFAPFHDIIVENLEFSNLKNYDFIHLKGKKQEGVCLAEDYKEFANHDINITPFCETRCPFYESGCPYYETIKQLKEYPQHWAGVHSHIPTFLQTFFFQTFFQKHQMYEYFDVIILDEFPFQTLFNQVRVSRKDIDLMRDVLSQMEIDTPERHIFSRFLDQLTLASGLVPINHHAVKNVLMEDRGLDYTNFIKQYDYTLLHLIGHKLIERPPKKILHNFRLLYEENPPLEQLEWMIFKHRWDGWMDGGIYITTSNISYFQKLPIPVVALDATAESQAWRTLLQDPNCNFERIDIEYKRLYQTKTHARYPVASWVSIEDKKQVLSDAGTRLCNLIKNIANRKENNVLVCSNKRIRGLVSKYLQKEHIDNIHFAVYYNLRSRNDFYEDCDTCIIAHEPNIPPLQLEIMQNVTGWDTSLLRALMTKDEILQAIGRIRQNILKTPYGRVREPVEIYVFPGSMDVSNKIVPEAKLVPYNNLMVGKLLSVSDILKQTMKNSLRPFTFEQLRTVTKNLCSRRALQSIITNLEQNGYISKSRGCIKWTFDEVEALKTNYRRLTI